MVCCSEKGAVGLWPRRWQRGYGSSAGWRGWQPVNGVPKKSIVCHGCGHCAKKPNPWHDSAEQRRLAERIGVSGSHNS